MEIVASQAVLDDLVVINKQDLLKDKLIHLNEPFQLINSKDKIQREKKHISSFPQSEVL